MSEVATGSTGVRIQMIANEPAHECDTRARSTNGAQLLLHIEAKKGGLWLLAMDITDPTTERATNQTTNRARKKYVK